MYQVEVDDGVITEVVPDVSDPNPSALGRGLVDGVQHDKRIRQPAIRRRWLQSRERSSRGGDEFIDVPWDEALDLAAEEIERVAINHGNTSIFAGSYGWASAGRFHHAQSQLHRFINLVGGSTRAMNTYSTAAAQVILPHVVATWQQMELEQPTWDEIADGTGLFVAFGGVPLRNTQVAYGGITEHRTGEGIHKARSAGVRFVNVSPVQGDFEDADDWIACRPGTDVALMLAIAYTLEVEDLLDRSFLDTHCVGYEVFREYVLGRSDRVAKSPAWAAQICNVPEERISILARDMAAKRTFISAAWSLQRAHHGEQPYWMTVTLAAMLGQVGLPGGGFGFGYGAEGFIGSGWRRIHWPAHSKGRNPTGMAIPVARIADMLLHPGDTVAYDGREITYPDIRLIYWAGGNPWHHHQDLNRLANAWRKPETVIVNEPWWTPTAKWADIVFPATTQLERRDICASSHDPWLMLMDKVLDPQHEARSDFEIFRGLSERFGLREAFDENRDEDQWLEHMWSRCKQTAAQQGVELPEWGEFTAVGRHRIPDDDMRKPWMSEFRADPDGKRLRTPSGKIEIYSETIASFDYSDCPGHATWLEPAERLGGQGSERCPLHLLSPQPSNRLHSQFDHSEHSQKDKIDGKEALTMHPQDAEVRGIAEGEIVRVFNDRGACLAGVRFDAGLARSVVSLPTGAWFKPDVSSNEPSLELNGNPNVLTLDIGTSSLAQGPSANTCLVEVEPYDPQT